MPGGLMNLVSTGDENIILNFNPKKTFYKATYAKHTNFGLQKIRIDYEKQRQLNFLNETELSFKIKRHADLLFDTYICVSMPNIYSPLYWNGTNYGSYKFQWVKNLGTTMIKEIQITCGSITLAKYSGEYIHCLSHRDLSKTKKSVFDQMIGHTKELNDPANTASNNNVYPNSFWLANNVNPEPSIRQRKLYIPLTSWFSDNSKLSIPLIALQYHELEIKITFRPIKEIYTILDVENTNTPRISPDPNNGLHQIKRFIRKPIESDVGNNPTITSSNEWNSDVHLIANYVFLEEKERQLFARDGHSFLIKHIIEHDILNQTGSRKIDIPASNCVSNYMFRFRRSDVKERNEWTNYTNWKFENVRPQLLLANGDALNGGTNNYNLSITGGVNNYPVNLKNILLDMAVLLGGEYRENILDQGVYLYCEKYSRTPGGFKEGLYHYSFALNTDRNDYQPSGSMNLTKYGNITFEYNTIETPVNPNSSVTYLCGDDGELIGIRKNTSELNLYNYDFKIFEEKYNVITIQNGMTHLMIQN